MSNQKFVVSHMEKQMGPFDEQELKSRWAAGEILAIDYIYDETKSDWILLSERFAWAKAAEVSPPPPVRTDLATLRSRNAPSATPPAAPVAATPPPAAKVHQAPVEIPASTPIPGMQSKAATPAASTPKAATPAAIPAPAAAAAAAPAVAATPAAPLAEVTQSLPSLGEPPEITLRNWSAPEGEEEHISELMLQRDTEPLIKLEAIQSHSLPAKPAPLPTDAKITMVDGVGELELQGLNPGKMELVLEDQSKQLKMQEQINVKPAEPVEVVWTVPRETVVGHDLEISIQALDEHGKVCLHYTDQFVVQVRGSAPRDLTLNTQDGQALIKLQHTKAEHWTVSLHYSGLKNLKLPEKRSLEWQAGPAARLVLDGPHEYIAGRPAKVKVKAVDSFGNVAKHFQGTVALEVKAS